MGMTMLTNKIAFVLPTYREYHNLLGLLPELLKIYPQSLIIIADDNSGDGTAALISDMKKEGANIVLLPEPGRRCIRRAVIRGMKFIIENSAVDVIVQMDADFSHRLVDIEKLIAALDTADVSIASKFSKGSRIIRWSVFRKILSFLGNYYIKFLLGLPIFEATSGFKAYKTAVLKKIDLNSIKSKGYIFQAEILYKLRQVNADLVEIATVFEPRKFGRSKMNISIVCEGLFRPILLRCSSLINRP